MLNTLQETTTPLGLVVIDGYEPARDWLQAESLLAVLDAFPTGSILWCGKEPELLETEAETYRSLVGDGTIVRDKRPLAQLLVSLAATRGGPWYQRSDEPGIVSMSNGKKLVTTPELRLSTQASATIVDDSWLQPLQPLPPEQVSGAFSKFHAVPGGTAGLIAGIRHEFSIVRDFESGFRKRVERAIQQHHKEEGAIVLHGQSGIGKSIALGRLAVALRKSQMAAVLFASGRLPLAPDIGGFLVAVDKAGGVTVLIADCMTSPDLYDGLLQAFRSRGHRVVVVGSSYKVANAQGPVAGRHLAVPAELSAQEAKRLNDLPEQLGLQELPRTTTMVNETHALARFYWRLPSARGHLSEGLGKEAGQIEASLRARGAAKYRHKPMGTLGRALLEAGYAPREETLIKETEAGGLDSTQPAGQVIDYVMVASRLGKWVPVNLLLRAVVNRGALQNERVDAQLIKELFHELDIFRWQASDYGEDWLVGARLQLEAELLCNRRLGGPASEAGCLIGLIGCGRPGIERSEELRFLVELVQALGPDGRLGERYKDSYAKVARALTDLRHDKGVRNPRLMLQESTLRRHYVRTHPEDSDRTALLDEARSAVDEALEGLEGSSQQRRTKENLWVERAAIYGYVATASAEQGADGQTVWSSYAAARQAVRNATAWVDSYYLLDIGLWLPVSILESVKDLDPAKRYELEADILSNLDLVDQESLEPTDFERFQKRQYKVGNLLKRQPMADSAFAELDRMGSTVGYYLRARDLSPPRPGKEDSPAADVQAVAQARVAADSLWQVYGRVAGDFRCLSLLLSCEWLAATGHWLFHGQRQPLPVGDEQVSRIRKILSDIILSTPNDVQAKYRYLDAVFKWLAVDEQSAKDLFRALQAETEYVDRRRVIHRHTVTDEHHEPVLFEGTVERQISDTRWSVFVAGRSQYVTLVGSEHQGKMLKIGHRLSGFPISFNYIGPVADIYAAKQAR